MVWCPESKEWLETHVVQTAEQQQLLRCVCVCERLCTSMQGSVACQYVAGKAAGRTHMATLAAWLGVLGVRSVHTVLVTFENPRFTVREDITAMLNKPQKGNS